MNMKGGLKTRLKKPINGPKCLVFQWSAKSCDFTIRKQDTLTVQYSDESGIQVFGIQIVTVRIKFESERNLHERIERGFHCN